MVERLKMPVAGPHNAPVPAPEYDYDNGIVYAATITTGAPQAAVIPAGTYKISCDTDLYYKCTQSPVALTGANANDAGVDYVPAGSSWHETFDGSKKLVALAKTTAGYIRLIPIAKIA